MHTIRLRPRSELIYIAENRTVLGIARSGFVEPESHGGLFVDETRVLSQLRYFANGSAPRLIAGSAIDSRSWLGYFLLPAYTRAGGRVGNPPQQGVELKLHRQVSDGLQERLTLTNYTQEPVAFTLSVLVDADFRDVSELESGDRLFDPRISACADLSETGAATLTLRGQVEHAYDHGGVERGVATLDRSVVVSAHAPHAQAQVQGRELSWTVELAPHQCWLAELTVSARIEGEWTSPASPEISPSRSARRAAYLEHATHFSAPGCDTLAPVVINALARARDDLLALRLYDRDRSLRAWTPAAGLPIFLALFGRDSLTAAWQSALLSTDVLRGALPTLAAYQGKVDSDWRDEAPGKMLHQARTGPLSQLNILPWSKNYASVTPSAFWPVALVEAWRWTGDRAFVEAHLDTALRALRWCDEHGDLDGDGLYEYQSRSAHVQKNQAWKDSEEAIVHADGSQADAPIGTCEEQAYVFAAKMHMVELLLWLDRKDDARRVLRSGQELKKRFNHKFWMPDEEYFALGFDGAKRLIRSITSNPGHCLAAGIVDDALVQRTADRLLSEELFSGWGVRTLSCHHPAYNPYAYQRGTVWPVEQGTFALGFMRHGLFGHVDRLCRAQFEAAALFEQLRLPECFGGQPRDAEHPFPSLYVRANSPQAWSSSALFCMVQAMLGLYPYAPLHLLFVDPHLPAWLPELTLSNLHVGEAVLTLRFIRDDQGHTAYKVLEQVGKLRVLRQPSPWSLTASLGERVLDVLRSLRG